MIGGILGAFGLEKGGEVEYAADGINTTNAKAFPLLVESGERVQVTPTAPGGGVHLGKLWDEVKPYILGAAIPGGATAAYKIGKGGGKKEAQAKILKQFLAERMAQHQKNTSEWEEWEKGGKKGPNPTEQKLREQAKQQASTPEGKAGNMADQMMENPGMLGEQQEEVPEMFQGQPEMAPEGTEGLDLTTPPDEQQVKQEQKQGVNPMSVIGPIIGAASAILPALLKDGGEVQTSQGGISSDTPKMQGGGLFQSPLQGTISSALIGAGNAELGGTGTPPKEDSGTGEGGIGGAVQGIMGGGGAGLMGGGAAGGAGAAGGGGSSLMAMIPMLAMAADKGADVQTPSKSSGAFSSALLKTTQTQPMTIQNYNFLKSPLGKALTSMGILNPPVGTMMAGSPDDSTSWGDNPAAAASQTLQTPVAQAAEGGNMDVHPIGCRCAMCTGGAIKMSKGGEAKVHKVMHEWGQGNLHSGSKHGPVVTSQKQAVAIAKSEAGESNKAAGGIDFIVPPGHDNDTFPMKVLPGTHVKVTPKDKVKTMLLMELAKKKGKKEAVPNEEVQEVPKQEMASPQQMGPQMNPEFMMLLNKLMGGQQ